MKVVFHEDFHQVYTNDPAAAEGRIQAVVDVLAKTTVEWVQARPALEADLLAVHSLEHVQDVRSDGVYDIAALAAGAAIQAAELGLSEPCFGLLRPPGHHASAESSWGYCYFNNMAVALTSLLRRRLVRTAYVLDIDLHFGDGTVNILGGRFEVTVHNVEAQDRRGYLDEVRREMTACRADLIGVSAGFDNHEEDWGRVLKTEDYWEIGRLVRQASLRIGGGCFGLLEGGYNHEVLGRNVAAFLSGLGEA